MHYPYPLTPGNKKETYYGKEMQDFYHVKFILFLWDITEPARNLL